MYCDFGQLKIPFKINPFSSLTPICLNSLESSTIDSNTVLSLISMDEKFGIHQEKIEVESHLDYFGRSRYAFPQQKSWYIFGSLECLAS